MITESHFTSEEDYDKSVQYSRSKLSNLLFTYELQRKIEENNLDVTVVASHPGISETNLANHMLHPTLQLILKPLLRLLLTQSASKGALPSSRASTDPNVKSGEYYGPHKRRKGWPVVADTTERAHDEETAKKLWEITEKLTGITFEF